MRFDHQLGLVSRKGSTGGALRLCQSPSTRVASKKCQFSKRIRKKKEKGVVFFCIVSLGSQIYVTLRSCDIGCAKAEGRMCLFALACVPFACVVARSISSTNKFAARPCCKKTEGFAGISGNTHVQIVLDLGYYSCNLVWTLNVSLCLCFLVIVSPCDARGSQRSATCWNTRCWTLLGALRRRHRRLTQTAGLGLYATPGWDFVLL